MHSEYENPRTTTILTIELPFDVGFRLRKVMRARKIATMNEVALEAIELWLKQHEPGDEP